MRTTNPITTAIRSWVLRSPGRLASGIAIMVAILYLARLMVTTVTGTAGDTAEPLANAAHTHTTSVATKTAATKEITETEVTSMPASSIRRSPATAAMYYAHEFVDTTASPTQWAIALSRVTRPEHVNDTLAAARPTAQVSILGPTRTLSGTGTTGTTVEIDTSAGTLTVAVTDTDGGWQVDSPLPTLDLDDVDAAPTTPRTTRPSPATALSPERTPEPLLPSEPAPPAQRATIPELDTPLPGPIA
ncbi:hypothetical protein [Rhodococcus sp. USK13]|uniref:hypothetical protein n=1 Tax=Rhodococcus sp. USK13 TaxID=2806442 RepID=UPI001BD19DE2|nr:hypothetical protein [Rhodococcus sp. USK13]